MSASALSPKPKHLPAVGAIWQHKKGGIYRIDAVSRDCEDPDRWLITYSDIATHESWVRPAFGTEGANFLDPGRFKLFSGPATWEEGHGSFAPLGSLAVLYGQAMKLRNGEPLSHDKMSDALAEKPRYRRLLRVLGLMVDEMWEDAPEVEEPA